MGSHASDHLGGRIQADSPQSGTAEHDERVIEAWSKSHLLTFDGGGIRGHWSLLVTNKLMGRIAEIEEGHEEPHMHSFAPLKWPGDVSQLPLSDEEAEQKYSLRPSDKDDAFSVLDRHKRFLPCHYFDYIGGSSTGGLIAIMLGRLRMTVPDCLAEYEMLGEQVFGKPRTFTELNFAVTKRTKYNAENVKRIYQAVTERRGEKTNKKAAPTFITPTHTCHSYVTTLRSVPDRDGEYTRAKPYILRSYKCTPSSDSKQTLRRTTSFTLNRTNSAMEDRANGGPKYPSANFGEAHDFEVWEVARAATAARYFFDPIKIRDRGRDMTMLFEDGGLGESINPTYYGLSDIRMRHGADSVGIVVSISTARGEVAKQKDLLQFKQRWRETVETACDPQTVHNNMLDQSRQAPHFQYYRFNPDHTEHLLSLPFDDWLPKHSSKDNASGSATLKAMHAAFDSWCSNDESVNAYFEQCAQALVRQRRLRLQDKAKWERYAIAAAFACQQKFCSKQDRTWTDVFDFERHLEDEHDIKGSEVDGEKSRARWPWQYRQAKLNEGQPAEKKKKRRWGVL